MNSTIIKLWQLCGYGQAGDGCSNKAAMDKGRSIVLSRAEPKSNAIKRSFQSQGLGPPPRIKTGFCKRAESLLAKLCCLFQGLNLRELLRLNTSSRVYGRGRVSLCSRSTDNLGEYGLGEYGAYSCLSNERVGASRVQEDSIESAASANPSASDLSKVIPQEEPNSIPFAVKDSNAALVLMDDLGGRGQASLKVNADQELLTCLVNSQELAGRLLQQFESLHALAASHPAELRKYCGEPELTKLCIAFELGRRICRTPFKRGEAFHGSRQVYDHFHSYLREERQECFIALYLDARHRLIAQEEISRGSLTASLVHPREVLRPAIRLSAAAMLCVHNHPSGDCLYSKEDLEVTKRLKAGSELVGIDLLDHIIIGDHGYFSFADAQIGPFE